MHVESTMNDRVQSNDRRRPRPGSTASSNIGGVGPARLTWLDIAIHVGKLPFGHIALLSVMVLTCSVSSAIADDASKQTFQQRLERALELNTTEPWPRSQAILDELAPRLPTATPQQRAEYLLLTARNQALAGNMEEGMGTLRDMLADTMTVGQRIRAYGLAANISVLLRDWNDTFDYLIRALEHQDELDPSELQSLPLSLGAYTYAMVGQIDDALGYGRQAVDLAREHGTRRDLCIDQGRLAFVYKKARSFDRALRHYREALTACLEAGDELAAGVIESGLGDLLRETGQHARAEASFESALSRLTSESYEYGLAETRFYSARLQHELDRPYRVQRLLERTLVPLEEHDAWDYLAEAHGMLVDIAEDAGEHGIALEHMRQQLEAQNQFLDSERARQLAFLQVTFDTRSREQELALLREQQRVSELETESRRNHQRLGWLVSGLIGLTSVALFILLAYVLRERRHFRRLSRRDGLTQLSNHNGFFDNARRVVSRAHDFGQELILVVGDVDFFKSVNDEFGHIAGDNVLAAIADVFRESFPEASHIGRIGGEEFAVLDTDTTVEATRARLDTLRQRLADIDVAGIKGLTMSFGIATLREGEAMETFRRRADEALYRAKHEGRDKAHFADEYHDAETS